jgi:hypothetical protein
MAATSALPPIPKILTRSPVLKMKSKSRIRDFNTSKGPEVSRLPSFGKDGAARETPGRTLWKKEREPQERGQKPTGGGDSFKRMWNDGWIHAVAGMALGALGAWLGIATAQGSDAMMFPILGFMTAGLAAAGVAILGGRLWPRLWAASGPIAPPAGFTASPAREGSSPSTDDGPALLGHEMKNYLCTLKGNARLLRQRVNGRDQAILDRIDRVVEKLESFTRGMAVSGDAATGLGEPVPFRPVDAARACARTHFHKRMGDFRFSEDTQAAEMLCDPGRFEQVLLNLYANAMEAGARRIDTEVRRDHERLLVRIEDDGVGCAREDLQRIFEPFFTTKTGPARRGLGMFIVQSIVENHGGHVRVAAKNGGADGRTGLIFTLDFPLPVRIPEAARPVPLLEAEAPAEESWLLVPPVCVP